MAQALSTATICSASPACERIYNACMTWKQLVDRYVLADGNIDAKAPVLAVDIIIAYNAQGVIDNGGFTYFFGADFPGKTHRQVSETFLRLGLSDHSRLINEMLTLFP